MTDQYIHSTLQITNVEPNANISLPLETLVPQLKEGNEKNLKSVPALKVRLEKKKSSN